MNIKSLLPGRLGFGSAPLGNMYRAIPGEEATATVEAAWDKGIRYFDTAPFYGAGLAEIRLGEVLAAHPRDEFVLSTKVGRIILDEVEDTSSRDLGEKGGWFEHGHPNKIVYDYSADGTHRSIEDSLTRLKTDRLDIVWVHDVSQDFHGDEWLAVYDIVVGGPYSSGVLVGGAHFEYQKAPADIIAKVKRITSLAERHGVGIKAVALQFSLAHPVTAAAIPGASRPSRITEDVAALNETVPAAFWAALRQEKLIAPDAPVPTA